MTRQAAHVRPPVVLTIAGSDSGGGAGIQADLKTIEAGGAFGTSAITSVTAQNTLGVEGTHGLPIDEIEAQIDAVVDDFDVAAVKTGMLGTSDVVETVVDFAAQLPNLVVDPVMVAASGDRLLDPAAESAYEALVAEARLVTPNADEAEVLTGVGVTDVDAARTAGERLVETGAEAALVKGGHVPGDDVVDVFVTAETTRTFRHDRVETDATHGSGCMLSSAIATRLAHGDDLASAVGEGVSLLAAAVRYGNDVGEGPGAVHHLVETRNEAARGGTVEAVETVVDLLVERDPTTLVPSEGITVVGATPYAESPRDVAGANWKEGPANERAGCARPNAPQGSNSGEFRSADNSSGLRGGETASDETAKPSPGPREDGGSRESEVTRERTGVDGSIARMRDGLRPGRSVRFGATGRLGSLLLAVREVDPAARFALDCRHSEAVKRALSGLSGPVVELPSGDGAPDGPLAQRVATAVADDTASPVAVVDSAPDAGRVTLFAPDAGTLVERIETLLTAVED